MTVKRFFAENARDCLRKVKESLGPDAIVVSNKPAEGGVEIMAMSVDSLDALSRSAAPPAHRPSKPATPHFPPPKPAPGSEGTEDDYTVSLSTKAAAQSPFRSWQPPVQESAPAAAHPSLRRGCAPFLLAICVSRGCLPPSR